MVKLKFLWQVTIVNTVTLERKSVNLESCSADAIELMAQVKSEHGQDWSLYQIIKLNARTTYHGDL